MQQSEPPAVDDAPPPLPPSSPTASHVGRVTMEQHISRIQSETLRSLLSWGSGDSSWNLSPNNNPFHQPQHHGGIMCFWYLLWRQCHVVFADVTCYQLCWYHTSCLCAYNIVIYDVLKSVLVCSILLWRQCHVVFADVTCYQVSYLRI